MKITHISIKRHHNHGDMALVCTVVLDDGSQVFCAHPWRNTLGLWASDSDAREPAEISATLRAFAKAIDDHCKQAEAA